jgi:hypothetical protein
MCFECNVYASMAIGREMPSGYRCDSPASSDSVLLTNLFPFQELSMFKRLSVFAIAATFILPMSAFAAWPPELHTNQGNGNFENAAGQRVVLRGVGIKALKRRPSEVNERYINWVTDPTFAAQNLTGHHAKVIRLCVESYNFDPGDRQEFVDDFRIAANMQRFRDYFNGWVLPCVRLCRERGVYCIVDLHYVTAFSNARMQSNLIPLWNFLANHPELKNQSGVMFELLNEPIYDDDVSNSMEDYCNKYTPAQRWTRFKNYMQPLVNKIRNAWGCRNIILVGSSHWDTDFDGISVANSINGKQGASPNFHNIAYVYHLYPKGADRFTGDAMFNRPDTATTNKKPRGGDDLVRANLPMFITEFSWTGNIGEEAQQATTAQWGQPLRSYLDGTALPTGTTSAATGTHRARICWTPWVFDPQVHGALLADYSGNGTPNLLTSPITLNGVAGGNYANGDHYGWFLFKWLQDKRFSNQP